MKIIQLKTNGFCYGVKNAIDIALSTTGENIYCYKSLVHNPIIEQKVLSNGIKVIDNITDLSSDSTLIIPAHGAGKHIFDYCEKNNICIIDTTCINVKNIQKTVYSHHLEGYKIILFGDKNHTEVIGINNWCDNLADIYEGMDNFSISENEKYFIAFQTTFSVEKSKYIIEKINKLRNDNIKIYNSVCNVTNNRQKNAEKLSLFCDFILVIGGKNSSNTGKLFEICKKNNNNVYMIEYSNELDDTNTDNIENLGIITGASTPEETALEVIEKIKEKYKKETITLEFL